jgi:hypothetical protein
VPPTDGATDAVIAPPMITHGAGARDARGGDNTKIGLDHIEEDA